jgi:hypothetical protein
LRIAYPTLAFGSWGAGDKGTRDRVSVSVNGRFRNLLKNDQISAS